MSYSYSIFLIYLILSATCYLIFVLGKTLLAADYFAMGKIDAKFISGMKRIAER